MNYADDDNITKRINDPHFKDLNKISENTYEVFSSKEKLKWTFLFKLVALFMTLLNCACCNFIMIVLIIILTAQTLFIARWTRIALILPSVVNF